MPAFNYLTDAEAKALTRNQLLERITEQQSYHETKRHKTPADETAMDELSQIIERYLNINAGFDAAFATIGGHNGPSYWDSRPIDDAQAATAAAPWPSSAAPTRTDAAVFARLTPERLVQLYAAADDDEASAA